MNIVLIGAPGSGKGTQAQLIAKKYGFEHVSTGDLFRYEISNRTPLGIEAETIINRGDLCPDDITLGMLGNHIMQHEGGNGFILDGVPRTIHQAKMLDDSSLTHNLPIDMVIYIHVTMEEVEKRILKRAELEKRADDTPDTIKSRVTNFFALTFPLEKYYSIQHKLHKINGMQNIDQVFADICAAIDAYRSTH